MLTYRLMDSEYVCVHNGLLFSHMQIFVICRQKDASWAHSAKGNKHRKLNVTGLPLYENVNI